MKRIALNTVKLSLIASFFLLSSLLKAQSPSYFSQSSVKNSDGTIDLVFKVDLDEGWYMYNTVKIPNGPAPTAIDLEESPDYELLGELREMTSSKTKFDKGFKMDVEVFEKKAEFRQTIKPLKEGDIGIKGYFIYQTCNGGECIMNEDDIDIKVTSSEALSESGATPVKEKNKNTQGLLGFLLIAFLAGLGGVITPCVFPMIPMTVGFLISSGDKKNGIIKGLIFGISVILIYTLLGVVVSLFQSTSATDALGTHWIPNLIFAILFLVFAISFFGAFEITLPSGLANKADQKADKGGYIAAFFVALAMVIVSFSCTGPFVGSILAAAVTGGFALKPILGMAAFGFAFSLPFVIFSFFPGIMNKLPKSGSWLNMVKVVFAFVLLAFAIKFFYNVDAYFGWHIITRAGFLAIWVVLAALLGLYFLGKIRTPHDSEVQIIGWGRMFASIAIFSFAIYLFTGLFGAPLSSVSGLVPPPDGSTIVAGGGGTVPTATTSVSGQVEGYCGPAKYAGKHTTPYGLKSYFEIEQALECSKETGKPVLLSFKSNTCSVCKVMEATVWSDPQILNILQNDVILASLYVDDKTDLPENEWVISSIDGKEKKTLGRKLRDYQLSRFDIASQPYYVLVDANEKILTTPMGSGSIEEFLSFLQKGIENGAL